MPNTGIKERITTQWRYFTSDRKSIYTLIIALLIPVTYELMRFVPLEDTLTPHTFSMAPTLFLQKILGTDGIVAIAASYYYVIPHVLLLVGLLVMIFFSKNRPPWYYFTIAIMISSFLKSAGSFRIKRIRFFFALFISSSIHDKRMEDGKN